MEEKEVLESVLDSLNDALEVFTSLDDDQAHADIYWEIKDITSNLIKRIEAA